MRPASAQDCTSCPSDANKKSGLRAQSIKTLNVELMLAPRTLVKTLAILNGLSIRGVSWSKAEELGRYARTHSLPAFEQREQGRKSLHAFMYAMHDTQGVYVFAARAILRAFPREEVLGIAEAPSDVAFLGIFTKCRTKVTLKLGQTFKRSFHFHFCTLYNSL